MVDAGEDGVWIGTRSHGVARVQDGRVEMLSDGDSRLVTHVFMDRERQIWVGTSAGLQRFRRPMVQAFRAGSSYTTPRFVFVDSKGDVWTGPLSQRQTSRTTPAGAHQFVYPAPMPANFEAIGEDAARRVWLSDGHNIGYVVDGRFVYVTDTGHLSVSGVHSFQKDRRGQLWALAEGIGLYLVAPGTPHLVIKSPHALNRFLVSERFGTWISVADGGVEQHIDGRINAFRRQEDSHDRGRSEARPTPRWLDLPEIDQIRTIVEDGDSIWFGTFGGLRRWRGGKWTTWTSEHGLPGKGVVDEIAADSLGRYWLMTRGGILMAAREQFDATPDGIPRTLSFARIGLLDGIVPHRGSMKSWPRVSSDPGGRLFFVTMDSVVMVDPSEMTASAMAPPIVLESVSVDNQHVDQTAMQRFVEPSQLQFEYTSLNLRSPEYARFRYRLEGYDTDWTEAGTRRQATYGTLRPGAYRFRVIGAGSEGVWNDTGASFAFQIVPVFWRTWWFQLTMVAIGVSTVAAMHRLRIRQLARQFNLGLEARVGERTRIARELHDTLLQSFQGVLIHFQAATNMLPGRPDEAKDRFEQILDRGAHAITEGRDAVQSLRTSTAASDDLALALGSLAAELADDGATAIRVNEEGTPRSLRPVLRDDVYRIASEALRNAVRHGKARTIHVDIHYDERCLSVRVRDDGRGIDGETLEQRTAAGHWGLPGMRERAALIGGTLEIRSRLGSGTEIDLSVPGSKAYAAPARPRRYWRRRPRSETKT